MADQQTAEAEDKSLLPVDEYKLIFDTFGENQSDLLHTARYICARQADIDDPYQRALSNLARRYPELEYEVLKQALSLGKGLFPAHDKETGQHNRQESHGAEEGPPSDPVLSAVEAILELVPAPYLHPIFDAIFHASSPPKSSPRILSSLLVNAISDFEVFVSNLFTTVYNLVPQAARAEQRTYTWKQIASYSDLGQFKERVIDDAVAAVMHGTYESWLAELKKTFGIEAPAYATSFEMLEVFQRRHVTVHNAGYANSQYRDKLSGPGIAGVGERLEVDEEYLIRAADRLFVTALSLTAAAVRKIKDKAQAEVFEEYIGNQLYVLLQNRRFDAIADFAATMDFSKFQRMSNALVCKVNYWLALKRLNRFDECEAAVRDWDTDALEKQYKIARLALLSENDEDRKSVV